MVWLVPLALVGLFMLRGVGDFMQTYCPGLRRPPHRQDAARADLRPLPAPAGLLLRHEASGVLLSQPDLQHGAGRHRDDRFGHGVHPRQPDDRRPDRLPAVPQPEAHAVQPDRRSADRGSDPPDQPAVPALQPRIQNSMGDVTRVAKEAIEAPRVIRVFNAQAYEARMFEEVIEHNRRSHMRLMFTKGLSNPIVQTIAAIGLAGVLYLATVDAVNGQMTVGLVHVVHRRADAGHGAAAPAGQRRRPAAAGHRGRAEHFRGARRAARRRGRRPGARARPRRGRVSRRRFPLSDWRRGGAARA